MAFFERKPQVQVQKEINAKLEYINQKYIEIGRYVKIHLADKVTDGEIKRLLGEIDSTLAQLGELNDKLNALNGIKICVRCEKSIPVNVSFCPECGAKQPMAAQPSMTAEQSVDTQQTMATQQEQSAVQNAQPVFSRQSMVWQQGSTQTPPTSQGIGIIPDNSVNDTAPRYVEPDTSEQATEDRSVTEDTADAHQSVIEESADAAVIPNENEPALQEEPKAVCEQSEPTAENEGAGMIEDTHEELERPAESGKPEFVFCTQCGSKEEADMRFCSQCGSPLEEL